MKSNDAIWTFNKDPQRMIPDWKITKQSTNATISEKRIMGYEIKNGYDSLVWIWDFNNTKNNILLIGSVDKTLDTSTYHFLYTIWWWHFKYHWYIDSSW